MQRVHPDLLDLRPRLVLDVGSAGAAGQVDRAAITLASSVEGA
jgi:hypothetical protein